MNEALFLLARAVVGGSLVVAFALIGEVVKPKRFAGVFGAAPSVALANLALVAGVEGVPKALVESQGMIAGGVAMMAACAAGIWLVRHWHALAGSAGMAAVWLVVAALARVVVF